MSGKETSEAQKQASRRLLELFAEQGYTPAQLPTIPAEWNLPAPPPPSSSSSSTEPALAICDEEPEIEVSRWTCTIC